jgi:hypothetical protein
VRSPQLHSVGLIDQGARMIGVGDVLGQVAWREVVNTGRLGDQELKAKAQYIPPTGSLSRTESRPWASLVGCSAMITCAHIGMAASRRPTPHDVP